MSDTTSSGTAKRPMHILEIETFGRGGLIHYAYNLSCALAQRGHRVTLLTTAAYELEERSLPPNVDIVKAIGRFTGRFGHRLPGFLLRQARRAEAIFDAVAVAWRAWRMRPDVVHIHCTNSISVVYHLLLRLVGAPLAATAHVVTPHEAIPLQPLIYRRIHRLCRLIVAHSGFDRQRLLREFGVDPRRVAVIPHGEYGFFQGVEASDQDPGGDSSRAAAARQRFGIEGRAPVALFFGYIREYKGLDLLLKAWETVVQSHPNARLLIAGDPVRLGPQRRQELEDWAERVGAIHRFGYVPFSDVAHYFTAADVLVMPYRHISQSGVLYLALSLGVPVLATRVGALPEVLEDGESALLVEPESPAALSDALDRIFGDENLRKRLAAGGRQVAEEHSWPSIAQRTESFFGGLLDC
ncbi:MAG: glycosyltransferase family 4 protein [Acidobacteriota bacterium]